MAAGYIKGVQSQGVGTCPKHFVANNQEYYRLTSNSVVDDRTLREIYLASFEEAVKEAKPRSIMNSYNKLNGTYTCEKEDLLSGILKDEWGFEGSVVTDWGACDDPVDSINAGLDLIMPGPGPGNVEEIEKAINDGRISEETINRAVTNVLKLMAAYQNDHDAEKSEGKYDFEAGHAAARAAEAESIVLLKNENQVLPLAENEKIAFIGEFAKDPRYQGGGSSHINSYRVTGAWDAVRNFANISYAQGFSDEDPDEEKQEALCAEAVALAKTVDKVVIFAGLPDSFESEGYDRKHLDMPDYQNRLISAIADVQKNVIVVLHNGAPIVMPWLKEVAGVLECYLGGEAVGEATADVLFGKVNPSGRLPETFPLRIEDTPAYPYYGVERNDVHYREGVLVGYRYYNTMKRAVQFPFGYGLSYTTFAYSDLQLDRESMQDTDSVQVSVRVKNTGSTPGKEVVQLYVAAPTVDFIRPVRELRAFAKVALQAGEETTVTFELAKRDFAYWNTNRNDWHVLTGDYGIQICENAAEVLLEEKLHIESTELEKIVFTVNTPMGDLMRHPASRAILNKALMAMRGINSVDDADEGEAMNKEAMQATAMATPLRSMVSFSPTARISQVQRLIDQMNEAVAKS